MCCPCVCCITPSVCQLGSLQLSLLAVVRPRISAVEQPLGDRAVHRWLPAQEFVSVVGLLAMPGEEYSEAGRAVYPDGLYRILKAFYQRCARGVLLFGVLLAMRSGTGLSYWRNGVPSKGTHGLASCLPPLFAISFCSSPRPLAHGRYKARNPGLRYLITENGIADRTDLIRGPYLVEHLLAIHAAIQEVRSPGRGRGRDCFHPSHRSRAQRVARTVDPAIREVAGWY